ncbi:unnamed protein product [Rotaria sordida]|uniref:Uncharacterized protein n=1 Tax=Rotaria sordida TaxID=392033 RepID=A0A814YAA6_9BILA|nr:unnamed protein product [Rotaria sordida]CAF1339198.1 unnamed protein product [Rotaria sordida]CAF1398634.1 unnamed protein product [Rotaria sordida]CAF3794805.1 unnamed protein product [Rotaria sordida]CAF3908642.1 unnamed protein product [Rotaria sordida]
MDKIFEHWDDIMDSTSELISFEGGLAKLLCLKLWLTTIFIPNLKDTSGEVISLLRRIPADIKRQQIIDIMFNQLAEVNSPLQGSGWTELFDLVDPNQLKFKDLELITSISSYVKYFIKIAIITKSKNIDVKEKVEQLIQDFVNTNRFTLDLKSIIFLLQLVERPLTTNDQCTNDLEEIISLEIRTNTQVKNKIHDYLYNLGEITGHLESLRTILNFVSHSSLLRDFDRQHFLLNLLENDSSQSSHFYIEWFLYFMTNDNFSMNDDNERREYQNLIKVWTSYFEHDQSKLHVMMIKIDALLEPFMSAQTGSNQEKCRELFVHHMIDICFKQGKISVHIVPHV